MGDLLDELFNREAETAELGTITQWILPEMLAMWIAEQAGWTPPPGMTDTNLRAGDRIVPGTFLGHPLGMVANHYLAAVEYIPTPRPDRLTPIRRWLDIEPTTGRFVKEVGRGA